MSGLRVEGFGVGISVGVGVGVRFLCYFRIEVPWSFAFWWCAGTGGVGNDTRSQNRERQPFQVKMSDR